MNIDKFPINFPYGATSAPYSLARPHRGNDYPLNYQPVLIQGQQIGVSGATGLVSGPHTHVQAGRDEWAQQTVDSKPYVGKPGTVVKTGTASEWGNYVCIRVGDVNVFYCHLSKINVQVGQKVEEDMNKFTKEQVDLIVQIGQNRQATDQEKDYWSTQDATAVLKEILGSEGSRVFRTKAAQFDNVANALKSEYGNDENKKLSEIKKIVEG